MVTVENIVGKEENVHNQHFLLFPQCLQEPLCSASLDPKTLDCVVKNLIEELKYDPLWIELR